MRKTIQTLVYYGLPITLAITSIVTSNQKLFNTFGGWAIIAFDVVLFVKPLSVLTPLRIFKILMTYRRQLGLTTFWLFAFHAAGLFFSKAYEIENALDVTSFIFWGAVAGTGLTILAATSNDFAVKLLKRNWKKLHRIVYPTYYFALYHASTAQGDIWKFYVVGGSYALLKMLQKIKLNKILQK